MSDAWSPGKSLLAEEAKSRKVAFDYMNVEDLRYAARFWAGPPPKKLQREACLESLQRGLRERASLKTALSDLSRLERQILSIFCRYGGAISGATFGCELIARKIINKSDSLSRRFQFGELKGDPVLDLRRRLILQPNDEHYDGYNYFHSPHSWHYPAYPALTLHAAIVPLVEPAEPYRWAPSRGCAPPERTARRSSAQTALGIAHLAQTLHRLGSWRLNRSGSLAKTSCERFQKLMGLSSDDPMFPKDVEILYYEILENADCLPAQGETGRIDLTNVQETFDKSELEQAGLWVRGWIDASGWWDAAGSIGGGKEEATPYGLWLARTLVVWALAGVAHGSHEWLDLETFLLDFMEIAGCYCEPMMLPGITWQSNFETTASLEPGERRYDAKAYWFSRCGNCLADMLLVTFFHFGLIERGWSGEDDKRRYSFRLTPLGQALFGERQTVNSPAADHRALVVQPNFDVLLYAEQADAATAWKVLRFVDASAPSSGPVYTYKLNQESVYRGLESGGDIQAFKRILAEHGRQELPRNVVQSLADWSDRRESLVLRSDLTIASRDALTELPASAVEAGEDFVLLKTERNPFKPVLSPHNVLKNPMRTWAIGDDGTVTPEPRCDSVTLARLAQFADNQKGIWKVTEESVQSARKRGIEAERILYWLSWHGVAGVPPILELAIRNWTGNAELFVGKLTMLQVHDPKACDVIRGHARFKPLIVEHIGKGWFVVDADRLTELKKLLRELGFSFSDAPLAAPETAVGGKKKSVKKARAK